MFIVAGEGCRRWPTFSDRRLHLDTAVN